ncbi:hypothetical protein REJC140_04080 [Pseudorhizobium endolithicum]|uniref:Competence protein ComEC n=1 Tax=Pseudorhizobium endolithicum TaxID=1191678 RepID=A0ABM8PSS6_9HYPH|nr:ComEC/Rec2 family competence protein [Pseudorhizobium endolithicum]CAD7046355.1 hypothetical protein REJC140_04080 [Pseudorhizobium endolithicum]
MSADRRLAGPLRLLSRRKRVDSGWSREPSAAKLQKALNEEVSHGHAFLFIPVLIGGGAAVWFALPRDPPAFLVFTLLPLSLLALSVASPLGRIRSFLLSFSLLLIGAAAAEVETWRRATVILDSPVTTSVVGEVHRREPAGEGRWRYFIRVNATERPILKRPPEDVVLLARAKHRPFEAGDVLRGRARLSPPSGPALPGLNDFAFRSYYDGIGAVGFFYGAPQPAGTRKADERDWSERLSQRIFELRGTIADRIRATVAGDAGAFAAAIVTDERRAISEETTEALRISGLAHIVAISGLNMALAAGIFFIGLRSGLGLFTGFAQAWPIKKIAAVGALLMATVYYLISGFAVSAERAYLMMAVMLIAVLVDRAAISLRNVAISAIVILLVSPSEVMGPSFQMSFAATAALIAGYAFWSRRQSHREPHPFPTGHGRLAPFLTVWHLMAGIFATSLIGGLSTAIYSMDHFHRLSGYGLVANLAVMPIISFLVMPAGLVGMLLMPFGLDAPFLKLMGAGLEAVIHVAKAVSSWGGDVGVGRQHPWFLPVASVGLLLLTLLRTKLRLLGIPLIATAFLLSWQAQRAPLPDILVADDGTLVATLQPSPATNRTRPPGFVFDQWRRALLLTDPRKPVVSPGEDIAPKGVGEGGLSATGKEKDGGAFDDEQRHRHRAAMRQAFAAAGADAGRFQCLPKAWCVAVTDEGVAIAVVEDGRIAGIACDLAVLVVAPRAPFDQCRSGARLISGATLRRAGSLEISLNGSRDSHQWTIVAAMAGIDRPWSRHRLFDWRTGEFEAPVPSSRGEADQW